MGGALNLAAMGGLDHRVLETEIISRDFLFQARPRLCYPRKTNLFYFELLWGGDFTAIPGNRVYF